MAWVVLLDLDGALLYPDGALRFANAPYREDIALLNIIW